MLVIVFVLNKVREWDDFYFDCHSPVYDSIKQFARNLDNAIVLFVCVFRCVLWLTATMVNNNNDKRNCFRDRPIEIHAEFCTFSSAKSFRGWSLLNVSDLLLFVMLNCWVVCSANPESQQLHRWANRNNHNNCAIIMEITR